MRLGTAAIILILVLYAMLTPAIKNMIREGKLHQLDSAIQAAKADGMITMDESLLTLYNNKRITKETLLGACNNYEFMVSRAGA